MLVHLHAFFTEYILHSSLSKPGYNVSFNHLLLAYSLILCSPKVKKSEDYLTGTVNTDPKTLMLPEHQLLHSSPLPSFLRPSGNSIPYNEMTSLCWFSEGKKCQADRNTSLLHTKDYKNPKRVYPTHLANWTFFTCTGLKNNKVSTLENYFINFKLFKNVTWFLLCYFCRSPASTPYWLHHLILSP